MEIIKSDKVLALWRYSIEPINIGVNTATKIVVSFHSDNGAAIVLATPNASSLYSTGFEHTFTSDLTKKSLLSLVQTKLFPSSTIAQVAATLEGISSMRVTVTRGMGVKVGADYSRTNSLVGSQDGPYTVTKDSILVVGGNRTIGENETHVLSTATGNDSIDAFIVSPAKYFKVNFHTPFTPDTGGDINATLGDGLYSGIGASIYDAAPLSTVQNNENIEGVEIDFGSGDKTRTVWSTAMFKVNSLDQEELTYRYGVGQFDGNVLRYRYIMTPGNSISDDANTQHVVTLNTAKEPVPVQQFQSKKGFISELSRTWLKAVSSPVTLKGVFVDSDGYLATLKETTNSPDIYAMGYSGTIPTTWISMSAIVSGNALPVNAAGFVGTKTGPVYVLKSSTDPTNITLKGGLDLDDAGSFIDSRTDFFTLGNIKEGAIFPTGMSSNSATESANTISFGNIYVASDSSSGSLITAQLYDSTGLCVSRQTVTAPTGSGVTLQSIVSGYSSTMVAAKITKVEVSGFYLVEGTGTVSAAAGAQRVFVGDYSLDPIIINPEVF